MVLVTESSSAPGASLANGTFGHAIDFDDTFESIIIHSTSPVFATAADDDVLSELNNLKEDGQFETFRSRVAP